MKYFAVACLALQVGAAAGARANHSSTGSSCQAADLKIRADIQNKMAGACEDMCKEVGAYPKCNCPDFVEPDSTPGVMTWDELLGHMDQLVTWGQDTLRGWKKQAAQLQKAAHVRRGAFTGAGAGVSESCESMNLNMRYQVQNKLAGACESMCKEVGAYPKCNCPDFVEPDSTPGVMTWDELLGYMDNLVEWGNDSIRGWKATAAQIQTAAEGAACSGQEMKMRGQLQNALRNSCDDMCKEVGAFPKCNCPDFVEPDATPGKMTWDELLEYMDNLVDWSGDSVRGWKKMAAQLQKVSHLKKAATGGESTTCTATVLRLRAQLQNRLAGSCEEMCKEVGAFPKCSCPKFVQPDSTPGVMTWDELLGYMDGLVDWSGDTIRGWKNTASTLQLSAAPRHA